MESGDGGGGFRRGFTGGGAEGEEGGLGGEVLEVEFAEARRGRGVHPRTRWLGGERKPQSQRFDGDSNKWAWIHQRLSPLFLLENLRDSRPREINPMCATVGPEIRKPGNDSR